MGCKQSKAASTTSSPSPSKSPAKDPSSKPTSATAPPPQSSPSANAANGGETSSSKKSESKSSKQTSQSPTPPPATLYHSLLNGLSSTPTSDGSTTIRSKTESFWKEVTQLCTDTPSLCSYVDPKTHGTPLHVACSLGSAQIDNGAIGAVAVESIRAIIDACPDAVGRRDNHNHVPLEGVFSGIAVSSSQNPQNSPSFQAISDAFQFRRDAAELLLECDPDSVILRGNNLYRLIELLPDDVDAPLGPTAEFIKILVECGGASATSALGKEGVTKSMMGTKELEELLSTPKDDDVLALLYRRFVRQFDLSERFFEGDNSRNEVVQHRERYKNAAVNTFNIIELLLRRPKHGSGGEEDSEEDEEEEGQLVHNAVRVGTCPPDLLRYIVETNLEAVAETDSRGNLPLHYAAGFGDIENLSPDSSTQNFICAKFKTPESYSKYVIDELLYAYPDGAGVANADGQLPIALAIESGKKWIGGGIRSLYEAYPPGIERVNLDEKHPILHALSFQSEQESQSIITEKLGGDNEDDAGTVATGVDGGGGRRRKRSNRTRINKDESHDAIMLVQKSGIPIRDIIFTMWANEDDAGVQMLGCAALGRAAKDVANEEDAVASVALMGVTCVVNAMKNHPNEPAVQENACVALAAMAPADGVREVSFAASGAISTVVSAMQAHVSDINVQKEACNALRGIAAKGGAERATVVASVSGFTALVNAMGAHPEDKDVQREACLAMEVLTSFPDAYLPKLLGGQIEPLLQAAAENFPEDCLKPAMAVRTRLLG